MDDLVGWFMADAPDLCCHPFNACLTRTCLRWDQRLPVDFARPEGLVQAEVSWGQARASARKPYTGACPLRNPALPQPGHALWLWRGPLR